MSSTNSTNGQTSIREIINCASAPIIAGGSIIPAWGYFLRKSALQLGNQIPSHTIIHDLKEGFKASPMVAAIVGTQLLGIKALNSIVNDGDRPGVFMTLGNTIGVSALSVPILAALNGKANGLKWKESIKQLDKVQSGCLLIREIGFLGANVLGAPCCAALKPYIGDSKAMEYVASSIISFVGSYLGHPADTILNRLQMKRPHGLKTWQTIVDGGKRNDVIKMLWKDIVSSYAGAMSRATGVVIFNVAYKAVSELTGSK